MKTLLLIDTNSFIHRAFHALPPFVSPSGKPTGALYGLSNTLLKVMQEIKPQYVAAAFDRPEPTFRKKMFDGYKAHRPKAPDELISQIIEAHTLIKNMGIEIFEKPGFEADDIIGTIVKKFRDNKDIKIIILTGDLDTLQLVANSRIIVRIPKKGISEITDYDENAVKKRFGLMPSQLPDYKGLSGDASDNIPGVPGIGPKTATSLLQEFHNIEAVFERIKSDSSIGKRIIPWKDQAMLSKKLAIIEEDAPIEIELKDVEPKTDNKKLIEYFKELGFQSIVNRLGGEMEKYTSQSSKPIINNETIIIPDAEFLINNRDIISSPKIKVAYDWKEIIKLEKDVKEPIFDIKIAGWLMDPDKKDVSIENLSKRFLKKEFGEGMQINALNELYEFLSKKIKECELENVLKNIETPLIKVLASMEKEGIKINMERLKNLSIELRENLSKLEKEIYKEAGCDFNINSPKQLSEIIFNKLNITKTRQKITKTGQKSTAEEVLRTLESSHPIIPLILEYRESFKIKSAFIEPILNLSDGNRIHTTFLQTGTATGRLSSEKPNMQNIPTGSSLANKLRGVFEASQGMSLLSFDYSQLELRLLAHETKDEELNNAFASNEDIHRITASKVFRMSMDRITEKERNIGKTLNFGIIYGMGPRSFSKTSGIPMKEAQIFIREYFINFPRIKEWQEKIIEESKTFGYVKNLNGRRRWIFQSMSENPKMESEAERIAINMPIQSLGADIIKISMIKSFETIENNGWYNKKARLLLSIHDELLFEVSDDILKEAVKDLKECMENTYTLKVPLKVEVKTGKNWGAMEKYNV